MVIRKRDGSLTNAEKPIVKAMLNKGWRNQDIQALLNVGRKATVNSGRITEVKQDASITPASDEEVEQFVVKKRAYDQRTGLNSFDDERLIRARESMIVAVQIFNSPTVLFKTQVFAVLANIAWTYLLHEYYMRKLGSIAGTDGKTWALSFMLQRDDCPLTNGMKRNLTALKEIRDAVEHSVLGKGDSKWLSLFQACCLNFDRKITELFGEALSLQGELSFALQFAKLNLTQISEMQKHEIPSHIDALDARLRAGLTEEQLADLDYQFKVIYTFDSASKSEAHVQFVLPSSAEGKEISNILIKYKPADETHPYKPNAVCKEVAKRAGKTFTTHNHTQAWHLHKVRPGSGAKHPEKTNKEFCVFHPAHGDYTYSEKWVERLVAEVGDQAKWQAIRNQKI
ncbi:MAG: DUF3644 domain-containing protein [Rhodospirillales bacterium]|nr:DUF3644 domain-containing protein [Rhodospirillales bacterium]